METLAQLLRQRNMGQSSEQVSQYDLIQMQCKAYNEAPGDLDAVDGFNCSVCNNKGSIMKPAMAYGSIWSLTSVRCKCMNARHTIRNMQRSGLKNIIRDYTFDKFETPSEWQKTIKEAAEKYVRDQEGWFFIGGQSGAGKTHICTAICREFLLAGDIVKYMLWRDDIVKLKGLITDAEEYQKLMQEIKTADVLYIDDLFKAGKGLGIDQQWPTAADINIAFEILNYRYNNPDLLTIISSECTIGEILDIDEAVGGRIVEKSKVLSLKPDKSKNYRLKGAVEL